MDVPAAGIELPRELEEAIELCVLKLKRKENVDQKSKEKQRNKTHKNLYSQSLLKVCGMPKQEENKGI